MKNTEANSNNSYCARNLLIKMFMKCLLSIDPGYTKKYDVVTVL